MAGRRLRETILNILKSSGIHSVALATYTNAYAGYVTTKEEYDIQHYEGASTHFGPYTLMALQQEFGKLAIAIKDGNTVSGPTKEIYHQNKPICKQGLLRHNQCRGFLAH
jgi:neutral ceramidase